MNPNSERDRNPSSAQGIVSSIATASIGRIPSNARPPRLTLGGKLTTLLLAAFLFASCGAKKESNTAQPTSGSAPVAAATAASSPTSTVAEPAPTIETQRTAIPGETTNYEPIMALETPSDEITPGTVEVDIAKDLANELGPESVEAIDNEVRNYVKIFGANGHSKITVETMPPQAAAQGTIVELADPNAGIMKLDPKALKFLSQGSTLTIEEHTLRAVRHSAGHTFVRSEMMALQPGQDFIMVDISTGVKVQIIGIQGFSIYYRIILPDGTEKIQPTAATPLEEGAAQLVNRTLTEEAKGGKVDELEYFAEFDSPEYYAMGLFMQEITDKFFNGDTKAVIQLQQRHGLLPFIAQVLGKKTLSGSDVSDFLNIGDRSKIVGYNALVNSLLQRYPGKASANQEELNATLKDPTAQVAMQAEIEAGIDGLLAEIQAYREGKR